VVGIGDRLQPKKNIDGEMVSTYGMEDAKRLYRYFFTM
jgi:hypothetical protein